ncbi:response regulator [Shewanella sp. KX20019]|uniref:hybrid sensor histidine kinase/response regulator n=1 Tax=Shewanella sp. KX20019 TaxID=2803864 RepID=UPI00192735C8|nr:ATP-binding protein [Shewanella sp. KX20019]QQX81321.1 response regulator [Shewanella sp. KX20019]
MKFSGFVFVLGVFGTLIIDVVLWQYRHGELSKQYQSRANKAFESSRTQLIQHQIMMNALRSLFNASNEVTKAEFSLFSKDLLKIKSAIAFTLDPSLQLRYLSDSAFYDAVSNGSVRSDINDQITYDIEDFSTIVISIDEPKQPYLVYAVSHQRLQQKIDKNNDICERFTFGEKTFSNLECQNYEGRVLASLFRFHSEQFVDLPEYNTSYRLSVDYMPTKKELVEIVVLLLVWPLFGLVFSILIAMLIQNRIDKEKQRIESNSKLALLSTLNHEIRTPINAVLGYANMLKAQSCCSDSGKENLDKIIWSANLLNNVAQNTLTYSKASSGTLGLHYEEINLPQFLKKIDDYYRAFSHTHKKQLKMQFSSGTPEFLQLDDTKFFQLTTNFINNAFKYSSGDIVICSVKVSPILQSLTITPDIKDKALGGFIRVAVKDFGKGMSKASMEAIAKPFTTDLKSSSALKSGIGIGLYTCKKVIESVGGSIRIRSRKDQGTLVIFRFPYRQSHMETGKKFAVDTSSTARVGISAQKKSNQLAVSPVVNQDKVENAKHVILVDDNCFNLEVCKSMLESDGFTVITAKDERETINALNSFYDVKQQTAELPSLIVLMDYMLDETDGLTLISLLKDLGFYHPKYFILSANCKDEIPRSALFPEITFLQKPIDIKTARAL